MIHVKAVISWVASFIDLFYPNVCAACGNSLLLQEPVICMSCRLNLPETGFYKEPDNKVAQIFWGRISFVHCSSFLHYRKGNNVQKLIHQLKYKGRKDIGEYLGQLFGRRLLHVDDLSDVDIIVPVPLHPVKERKRGYNQSEFIAKGISAATGFVVDADIINRQEYDESQTKKDRYSRWENVQGRFVLKESAKVQNKHILIVDDVITSGSTAESVAAAFENAENTKLSIVSIGISY